eukprot:1961468-Pleurochrysis_carterae.AAC.2
MVPGAKVGGTPPPAGYCRSGGRGLACLRLHRSRCCLRRLLHRPSRRLVRRLVRHAARRLALPLALEQLADCRRASSVGPRPPEPSREPRLPRASAFTLSA